MSQPKLEYFILHSDDCEAIIYPYKYQVWAGIIQCKCTISGITEFYTANYEAIACEEMYIIMSLDTCRLDNGLPNLWMVGGGAAERIWIQKV